MAGPLATRLNARGVLSLDGGLATELERDGHDLSDPLWSGRVLLENPEAIAGVHARFIDSGADIITTATYQVTLQGLATRGLDAAAAEAVFTRAAELARLAARPTDALVAGSAGSYGAYLADGSEYRGGYDIGVSELAQFHQARAELLAASCDIVAFETVPCLEEATALAIVAGSLPPNSSVWVSFSCRDDETVCGGDRIEDCVRALADVPTIEAVGINCTHPDFITGLLHRASAVTSLPLVVYPNAGESYDGAWSGTAKAPAAFGERAARWLDGGARILGGCCRCGPAYVAALQSALDRARKA